MFKLVRQSLLKFRFKQNYFTFRLVKDSGLTSLNKFSNFSNKFDNQINSQQDDGAPSDEENDQIAQDKTVYDFIDEQAESVLHKIKCQGCGIHMQTESPSKIGYLPKLKLKEYLNPELKNQISEENVTHELHNSNLENDNENEIKEFERIHDKATLKKLKKLQNKQNVIICERCFKLTNYMNFDDLSEKAAQKNKNEKTNAYTTLVKKINSQKLIHQILSRISNKAHIFYICDISELESTVDKAILKEIAQKKIPVTFMVNKYDILPTKVVEERIRIWVGEYLKEFTQEIEGLNYSYILVSSINGHNFDYVIHKIKKIKEYAKENKIPRPKIFVIGNANVGKSSFINKLIRRANRHLSEERINKINYQKDYQINEGTIFENDDKSHLTASPLPGTTIGITKVESMKMGVKLFDTPGIPNKNSVNFLMENCLDIVATTIRKKITPFTCSIKQGYSIWLGAVARIDFLNGEDKYLSFFLSHHVTIHRTPLLNAEDLFNKHAGGLLRPCLTKNLNELKLVKHIFNLKCDIFSILNFDIVISGLGWFSISGKGLVSLEVNVPEGVSVYLRTKPIMPYEIKSHGVKKFFGKTINTNSKINRKFNKNK